MDTLTGSVERITYYNPENGDSVIRIQPDQHQVPGGSREDLATVVGNLPELSPGEHLRLTGSWKNHPKHGLQFQTETCEQLLPEARNSCRRVRQGARVGRGGQPVAGPEGPAYNPITVFFQEAHVVPMWHPSIRLRI